MEEGYANLDVSLKQFINRWSKGRRALSELVSGEAYTTKVHVTTEAELIKHRITLIDTELASQSFQRQLEESRKRLLSTLFFPEMNERENSIEGASNDIVHDVFEKSEIPDWLQSDTSLFWINGKAGSGKSTLVKCLIRHHQTIDYLQTWQAPVRIFRFFFYELGRSPLQRNALGCVRTLLYQLLSEDPGTLDQLLEVQPGIEGKNSEHDWSLKELSDTLVECLRNQVSASCLFVDGLDEIQTDERQTIVELVESLDKIPNVKICASCRPENIFRSCLGSSPTLKVQDLNHGAMLSHADTALEGCKASFQLSKERYQSFLSDLVLKSEGVFLWAIMAIKSLVRGLENGDSWMILKQRLHEFPPSLNSLYKQMWYRQNEDLSIYKKDAAKVFYHALYAPAIHKSWQHYLSATHQGLRKELQHLVTYVNHSTPEDSTRIRQQYERWLSARTAGLLEMRGSNDYFNPTPISFIHRSVREFLQGTKDGQTILSYDDRSTKEKYLAFFNVAKDVAHMHIAWAHSFKQTDVRHNKFRFQVEYSMALYMLLLSRSNGEPLDHNLEWVPSTLINPKWGQLLLSAAAEAGDVATLDQIHRLDGRFERISSQAKDRILSLCCGRLRVIERRVARDLLYVRNGIVPYEAQDRRFVFVQMQLDKLVRKVCCIEWLLKHGANADGEHEEYTPQRIGRRPSAFQLFVSNVFWSLVIFDRLELRSAGLLRKYVEAVHRCMKAMAERGSDPQQDSVLILQRGRCGHNISIIIWLDPAWILKFIEPPAASSGTIDILAALAGFDSPEFIHLHAVQFKGGPWLRPSPANDAENIRRWFFGYLDSLLSWGYYHKKHGESNGEIEQLLCECGVFCQSGSRLAELIQELKSAVSWEEAQGEDAKHYKDLSACFYREEDSEVDGDGWDDE